MGNKKICECGYWNQEQQECLYHGYGCIWDKQEPSEAEVEEFVEKYRVLMIASTTSIPELIRRMLKEYDKLRKKR